MLDIKIQKLKEYIDKRGGVPYELKNKLGSIKKLYYKKIWNNTQILEKYKAIYFKGYRVASSSLTSVFYEACFDKPMKKTIESTKFKKFTNRKSKKYKNYFKFTFIRNPYDRCVSTYEMRGWYPDFKEYKDITFKGFVKKIYKIPDEVADMHIKSQYLSFFEGGRQLVDYIGRFETLEKDYKKICKIIGIKPLKLLHKNKSKRRLYQKYYDKETIKLVAQRYKKDLELFNYKFGN